MTTMTRRRLASTLLVVVATAFATVGCASAPDRAHEANELEGAIRVMPGVASVVVDYENSFGRGSTLHVNVSVPDATAEQIAAVADTINRVRGDKFGEYDQSAEFFVTASPPSVRVKRAAYLDPGQIAEDAVLLRRFAADIKAEEISWSRGNQTVGSRLDINEVTTAIPETFAAIRAILGGTTAMVADIRPADPADTPLWRVTFPFTPEQQVRIDQQIAAMPGRVVAITVRENAVITLLNVALKDPATAYDDLKAVIAITGAGPTRPLWLRWMPSSELPSGPSGFVIVGGCSYPGQTGDNHPGNDIEERLRKEFDTCPR
ncbi:hypothetical protein [Mycobacterium sp.]|uniref:hypothetical protein n=1 Tax=Mycobacterium sp. TaxID=1785 RepID=UPI002D84DB51|nr:hypothetical protein [Mycobacterium sp.]